MGDEQKPEESGNRRFRITRKVKSQEVQSYAEQVMAEVDDADKGTPAENESLRRGCGSCLNVTLFFFVLMALSILGTCYITK